MTKQAQHTPGPWYTDRMPPNTGWVLDAEDNYLFAVVASDREGFVASLEQQKANLTLAAAAPDLLAVVEFLHEWVAAGADVVSLSALCGDSDDVTLGQAIRDAIAATR
jgi:hypothetical protein